MNLRWRIARALCRIPSVCNASVICWAVWRDREQLSQLRQGWACRSDLERNGRCYCGKLEAS